MARKAVIENTELTLNILRHFARDDVPYPSNLTPRDLHAVFRDQKPADIDYSVVCAIEAELLKGKIQDVSTMAGREIMIPYMDGLSQKGGEYVRHSASYYERAVSKIRENGIEVSTDILSAYVKKLAFGGFESWLIRNSRVAWSGRATTSTSCGKSMMTGSIG